MIQNFDTQLEVSLRALREVVAPALKNADGYVVEQFNLVLATLDFVQSRLPYSRSFHRLELNHLMSLAKSVGTVIGKDQPGLAKQLADGCQSAEIKLANPEVEIEDYLIVGRKLRELIAEAVRLTTDKSYERELDGLIVNQQKRLLTAQRAWCAPLGLDTGSSELPSIEKILSAPAKI